MGLVSHANVYNTCLRILSNRGFAMRVEGELDDDGCWPTDAHWIAEKDGFHFLADNPIELFGLVALQDHFQPAEDIPYWWRQDGDDVYEELMSAAFPD